MKNDISRDRTLYVREVQEELRVVCAPTLVVDGIYGPETADAVRAFQRDHRLPDSGAVDRATWDALRLACENEAALPLPLFRDTLRVGSRGDAVLGVCFCVNAAARRYPQLCAVTVQSEYLPALAEAVAALQRLFGLEPTGCTDVVTWNRLVRLYADGEPSR